MVRKKYSVVIMIIVICLTIFIGGCVSKTFNTLVIFIPNKTIDAYLEVGKCWGHKHWKQTPRLKPGKKDLSFVKALIDRKNLDFFWIHSDLKEAFKKGYRMGYEDRTADLVLGPHLEQAAIDIGHSISTEFVRVIERFEKDWIETLRKAIDVFIVLIAEGSQADREGFIEEFNAIYSHKYNATQALLISGGFMAQMSEGGTALYIDMTKVKAVLDIPSPKSLKTEIYHQTFKVMGDEMGRRFSHNLIARNDLIDWLRRSKTALQEVEGNNLGIIYSAFIESYGTDADSVFKDLAKEAGYNENLRSVDLSKNASKFKSFKTQSSGREILTIKSKYSTINVRPTPSKAKPSIAILKGGSDVEKIEESGNWFRILFVYNNIEKSGWAYKYLFEGYDK